METARRILESDPDARLLVCSGYSDDPLLSDPTGHGFRATVSKPFRLADLLESIAKSIA